MELTKHTDYAFRVMLYLSKSPNQRATVPEIAEFHAISQNHLAKVVSSLRDKGYIKSSSGRGGGIVMSKKLSEITLRKVVEDFEPHTDLLECFDAKKNNCRLSVSCGLKRALLEARRAFLESLEAKTLADLI